MPIELAASAVYDQLCRQANNKFVLALNRIRGACDALSTANATLSYSQVGKMAVQLYGGPKTQSILNNSRHKAYIDARRREQVGSNPPLSNIKVPEANAKYPSDALDYKTRRYIDDLRQRNNLLELAMRDLKSKLICATEVQPVDIARMITEGSNQGMSMFLETSLSPDHGTEVKRILKQLLVDLSCKVPGLEPYRDKGIRLRTGEWLLPPDQFCLLKLACEN